MHYDLYDDQTFSSAWRCKAAAGRRSLKLDRKSTCGPQNRIRRFTCARGARKQRCQILLGTNPDTGNPQAYIGEAEVIKDRLKQHKAKALEFWTSVVVFVSKDENLTKAHVRFLENRLWQESKIAGRYELENINGSNPKLPESDREDMEVYLSRIRQMLPVLGSDLLAPIAGSVKPTKAQPNLVCKIKNAVANGRRTEEGFVVFKDSTAVLTLRPSAETQHPFVVSLRKKLVQQGTLVEKDGLYVFTKDVEFSSPSAAAAVVHGGGANGLTAWRDANGKSIKELEEV